MDEITFALHNPLTEEEWDAIEDIDFDHTNSITFHTKHGKDVEFVKRKTGRWIPCSERLPEEGERVLATHLGGLNPNRQVIEHIYQNGEFTCGWEMDTDFHSPTFGQRFMGKVIAWMPLPKAYQEEER